MLIKKNNRLVLTTLIITIYIFISIGCYSENKKTDFTALNINSFDKLLKWSVYNGAPGIILYVNSPQKKFLGSFGKADLIKNNNLRKDHMIRIASLTKTFIATLVLQLNQEGKIDLEDTIDKLLPQSVSSRIENSNKITVRQLLNHTSGILTYTPSLPYVWKKIWGIEKKWSYSDALEIIYDKPALFKPGEKHSYSNTNYIILGLILDKILGYHHSIEIRKRILDPLNMDNTFYEMYEEIDGDLAHGYDDYDFLFLDSYEWVGGLPDGGMTSSAENLGNFIRTLFKTDILLNDQNKNEMIHNKVNAYERGEYGLGLYISKVPDTEYEIYYHTGHSPGYSSFMGYIPEKDTAIVVLINGTKYGHIDPVNIIDKVLRLSLKTG